MSRLAVRGSWQEVVFRANPEYELLTDEASLASIAEDLSVTGRPYGILRARRGGALPDHVASPHLALLFLSLTSPATIPAHFEDLIPGSIGAFIRRAVLDRVIEVSGDGGFASGPDARRFLDSTRPPALGMIAEMSRRAILYAVTLSIRDQKELALRVYSFGRQPALGDREISQTAREHPWVVSRSGLQATRRWQTTAANASWTMWRPRVPYDVTDRATFKLYVSPAVDDAPAVWRQTMIALPTAPGIVGVKLARGEPGLRRPDKIVAYFARMEDLHGAAQLLSGTLCVDRAHGVPLSAEIAESGLLSWGADRPAGPGRSIQSWRMWLADRVAVHALATAADGRRARTDSVLAALNAEGVDTSRWAPSSDFWASTKE